MSFQLTFKVHDDGAVEFTGAAGDAPAGLYAISGHRHASSGDYAYNSISITAPHASVTGGAQVPIPVEEKA